MTEKTDHRQALRKSQWEMNYSLLDQLVFKELKCHNYKTGKKEMHHYINIEMTVVLENDPIQNLLFSVFRALNLFMF